MKAVVINGITPAEKVKLTDVEIPKLTEGRILIKVKAFGLNHSEQILRLEEIDAPYIKKPVIPGIECVGTVEEVYEGSRFKKGDTVAALMGGMGRSFDGSYAEYALLPEHHVFSVPAFLAWDELGAIPETYFTAWGSLFECLRLTENDTLLIRGASCALGYAAIQIAKALGSRVIATTHRQQRLELIKGADEALLDEGTLTGKVNGVTKALDLVGPKHLKDTLTSVESGGIVCSTGILGGVYTLNDFDPIKDIPNGVYLTGFFSNYPDQGVMDEIFSFIKTHGLHPVNTNVYSFEEIATACMDMDSGRVNGKIVIIL